MKNFQKTRVVSKHLFVDWFQGLRNIFGRRLKGYEDKIQNTIVEIIKEVKKKGDVAWYRMSINELTKGAIMITVYGCYK